MSSDREYERFLAREDRRADAGASGDFEEFDGELRAGPELGDDEVAELEAEADYEDLMRERSKAP